jgi:hypothetical protein
VGETYQETIKNGLLTTFLIGDSIYDWGKIVKEIILSMPRG